MKNLFLVYLFVLLHFRTKGNCSDIAMLSNEVSHDQLNRFLKMNWCGQTLLRRSTSFLKKRRGGYILIDSTEMLHPYSKGLDGSRWMYSSTLGKVVYGYEVLSAVWTDGNYRIPIASFICKKGGKGKIRITLEILSYIRSDLKMKPDFVLMDSWFSARVILKRIDDYGWGFVTRFKKNRNFDGIRLDEYRRIPYWMSSGLITGGLKVTIVKHRNKYFATNRHSLTRQQIFDTYAIRQQIEEFFRCLKQECALTGCQQDNFEAQERHLYLSICTFLIIERVREQKNLTFYDLRNLAISGRTNLYGSINSYCSLSA